MDITVTVAVGAISAALLFLLFEGKLLSGELFPQMGLEAGQAPPTRPDPGTSAPERRTGFFSFMRTSGPVATADYAKLLVWAFIAGFAERLVPDTLTRFAERRTADMAGSR